MLDKVNAGRPQCPVGLNTLVVGRKTNSLDREPYVYLKWGAILSIITFFKKLTTYCSHTFCTCHNIFNHFSPDAVTYKDSTSGVIWKEPSQRNGRVPYALRWAPSWLSPCHMNRRHTRTVVLSLMLSIPAGTWLHREPRRKFQWDIELPELGLACFKSISWKVLKHMEKEQKWESNVLISFEGLLKFILCYKSQISTICFLNSCDNRIILSSIFRFLHFNKFMVFLAKFSKCHKAQMCT
jgi:hypothetical protein